MITVVVLTFDEAVHIERAIRSAIGVGPVLVVDSGSTDATVSIAEAQGARVVSQSWLGFAGQRNWGLDFVDSDWVLFLDADEFLNEGSASAIQQLAGTAPAEVSAFSFNRRNYLFGSPLGAAGRWPDTQTRLLRRTKVRYEARDVHEHPQIDGLVRKSGLTLEHDNRAGGVAMLQKHLAYAALEAGYISGARSEPAGHLSPRLRLRRTVKTQVWFRLPGRALVRYFWILLVKRGAFQGEGGRAYASLLLAYEAMLDVMVAESAVELAHNPRGADAPEAQ